MAGASVPNAANTLGPFGLMLTWYCLYFGVLNRDCAEVAANRMVSQQLPQLISRRLQLAAGASELGSV